MQNHSGHASGASQRAGARGRVDPLVPPARCDAGLLRAGESGQPAATRSIVLSGDTPGFHVMVPMSDGSRLTGFVVAAFSELTIERAVLERDQAPGWAFAVFEEGRELFRTGPPV